MKNLLVCHFNVGSAWSDTPECLSTQIGVILFYIVRMSLICLTTLYIYDVIQHGLTICTAFAIAREQDVYLTLMKLEQNIQ